MNDCGNPNCKYPDCDGLNPGGTCPDAPAPTPLTRTTRHALLTFLDWYDPEASHRDIGLEGVVDAFLKDTGLTSGRE